MKKIVLMVITVLGIIFVVPGASAVEYNDIDDIIIPTITYVPHGVNGLGDVDLSPSITNVINELNNTSYEGKLLYIVTPTRPIIFQYNYNNVTYTEYNVSRFEIIYDWYVTTSARRYIVNLYATSNVLIDTITYGYGVLNILQPIYAITDNTFDNGFEEGKRQYGYFNGVTYIPSSEYGQIRYDVGFNEAQTYYAYNSNGEYLTALQYGQIRYNEGYELGLTNEIDWFNWAFTFITMPVRILNVEVLPGIKIGYFALFTLMTGIVSWFFFIVGKGGRRK